MIYFRVIQVGMIFNVLSLVINAAQRGAGNTKIAMITNVTSSIVNIIFNYLIDRWVTLVFLDGVYLGQPLRQY